MADYTLSRPTLETTVPGLDISNCEERKPATITTLATQILFFSALLYGGWIDKEG